MKQISAWFFIVLILLESVCTLKLGKQNHVTSKNFLLNSKKLASQTFTDILKKLEVIIEQLEDDQKKHEEIAKEMDAKCLEEKEFRKQEIITAAKSKLEAKTTLEKCESSLIENEKKIPELKKELKLNTRKLLEVSTKRERQHNEYVVNKGGLNESSKFLKSFMDVLKENLLNDRCDYIPGFDELSEMINENKIIEDLNGSLIPSVEKEDNLDTEIEEKWAKLKEGSAIAHQKAEDVLKGLKNFIKDHIESKEEKEQNEQKDVSDFSNVKTKIKENIKEYLNSGIKQDIEDVNDKIKQLKDKKIPTVQSSLKPNKKQNSKSDSTSESYPVTLDEVEENSSIVTPEKNLTCFEKIAGLASVIQTLQTTVNENILKADSVESELASSYMIIKNKITSSNNEITSQINKIEKDINKLTLCIQYETNVIEDATKKQNVNENWQVIGMNMCNLFRKEVLSTTLNRNMGMSTIQEIVKVIYLRMSLIPDKCKNDEKCSESNIQEIIEEETKEEKPKKKNIE